MFWTRGGRPHRKQTLHRLAPPWCGVNILLKYQLSSCKGLGVLMFSRIRRKGSVSQLLMNHKGICKTAPATRGLLNISPLFCSRFFTTGYILPVIAASGSTKAQTWTSVLLRTWFSMNWKRVWWFRTYEPFYRGTRWPCHVLLSKLSALALQLYRKRLLSRAKQARSMAIQIISELMQKRRVCEWRVSNLLQ